jgi:hypothetical protein
MPYSIFRYVFYLVFSRSSVFWTWQCECVMREGHRYQRTNICLCKDQQRNTMVFTWVHNGLSVVLDIENTWLDSKSTSNGDLYQRVILWVLFSHIILKQLIHYLLQWYNFKKLNIGPTTLPHILILNFIVT